MKKVKLLTKLNKFAEQKFYDFVAKGGQVKREDKLYKQSKVDLVNIGFDTEDDSNGICHLLIFYDGHKYWDFFDKESALLWLVFSKWKDKRVLLWCVNTDYDINNLCWGYDYLIERFYNKSRLIFAKVVFNNHIRFYDLINFYSLSAEAVGKLFGLKKLNYDFTKRKLRKDGSVIVTKKEIIYCKRDTEIGQKAGNFICDKFKEFNIKQTATVASSALQIYLHHYDKIDFTQFNRNRYILDNDDVYSCYYGGRTEAFYYGKVKSKNGNIKYYDINSLYPFVMSKYLYPNPFSTIQKGATADIGNGIVCATVFVKTKQNITALPLRHNKKLVFPVGRFTGFWVIDELKNAVKNYGTKIEKVYWSYEWELVEDLFSEFVGDFWNKRLNAKTEADSKFYKIVMNSLYGKFAERRRLTRYVSIEKAEQFDPIVFNEFAEQTETYLPFHNNTIISAYVTAYGRMELLDYMSQVESKGGKVLYCDTDSIIYQGDFDLPTGTGLGQLKKEDDIIELEILGAKYYRYINVKGQKHFVCKGVPKDKQHKMFSDGIVHYRKPLRYREALRRKMIPNLWLNYSKKDLTKFDKRDLLPDGKNNKHLMLKERKNANG